MNTITLRDYQKTACNTVLNHINANKKKILIQMATGSGKSVVLASLIKSLLKNRSITPNKPAVVLTMSWSIVEQLYEMMHRMGIPTSNLCIVGGENKGIPLPQHSQSKSIYLSTLHSFTSRMNLLRINPSFVFHDEVHYGDKNTMCNTLCSWLKNKGTTHIGCTATPKKPEFSNFPAPVVDIPFSFLVKKRYLAQPKLIRVKTESDWSPQIIHRGFDFAQTSLSELNTTHRNRCIADHYRNFRSKYGCTLVFAINKEHAEKLGMEFARRGITCGVIHGSRSHCENKEAYRRFKKGEVDVLINVRMMTTGIDIPKIKTIFLCRPTTSEILYMQMVGRGARLYPNQDSFYVVDFVDTLNTHAHRLFSPSSRFQGSRPQTIQNRSDEPSSYTEHFFDPTCSPVRLPVDDSIPLSAQLLWFHEGQTFGVEIELSHKSFEPTRAWKMRMWKPIAEKIRSALEAGLGRHRVARSAVGYNRGNHDVWNVEYDRSVGWEVKTPILCGVSGAKELAKACSILQDFRYQHELIVNFNTSVHIHLGWQAKLRTIKDLLHTHVYLEPSLASLVAPSRIAYFDGTDYDPTQPNPYCKPLSSFISGRTLEKTRSFAQLIRTIDRYSTLNLQNLRTLKTVEFRMHSGSTNASKILLWLSLHQQILHAVSDPQYTTKESQKKWKKSKVIKPDNKICERVAQICVDGKTQKLQQLLHNRQRVIQERWRFIP